MTAKKQYRWIDRLIERITKKTQPTNDTFCFYGHLIVLQSGTVDYTNVMVYNTTDPYTGMLAEFSFDFWTYELNIATAEDEDLEKAITRSFKRIYGSRVQVSTDN